ncbi:MAG TPA: hypothetical protein VFE62_22315, partial [Gemmataceae bacterium]|nr:hypothetical protein [Gemmataceae bacterium]
VPTGKHAPTLRYRWNAEDDFQPAPLQSDGTGVWTTQLTASQLRAGVTYKISAGDAVTPEYQVRTRPPAHVARLAITYTHRPFRNLKPTTRIFPDESGSQPIIHGPVGSEVELMVHASRPVNSAWVQVDGKELPIRMLPTDPQAFACLFTLKKPGQFRIGFTTPDGETYAERESHSILVVDDDAPKVVLTQPGIDVSLPEDGTLQIAGDAVSAVGIKSMMLHLRVVDGPDKALKLSPLAFRDGKSLQFDDGTYPLEVPYQAVVLLNQLKFDKGIHLLPPGTVLEYWLEATDSADYPQATGNVGRSQPFKVTLLPKSKEPVAEEKSRNDALAKQKQFDDEQQNQKKKSSGGSGGTNPQQSLNQIEKEQQAANKKLNDAMKDKKDNQQPGQAKGAEQKQQPGQKKDDPQNGGQSSQPQPKPSPMSQQKDAGGNKDQGGGKGQQGESRDNGEPKKDDASKGDKKDGDGKGASSPGKDGGGMDKQESAGGARDGGPMGAPPQAAKDNASGADAPTPSVKNQDPPKDGNAPQGNAKGSEPNRPPGSSKDPQTAANPPQGKNKGGMAPGPNSGEAKQGPPAQANPGQARNDPGKGEPKGSSWDEVLKQLPNLPRDDKAGDASGMKLADIAKGTGDERKRDIIVAMLTKSGRDPKTGKKQKMPSAFGTGGKTFGISDDIKTTAANREFAARIGQMQLDDWKSRLTPDLLKKAGMTEADWQRYVKNQQNYDALVRQLNARAARQALKELD